MCCFIATLIPHFPTFRYLANVCDTNPILNQTPSNGNIAQCHCQGQTTAPCWSNVGRRSPSIEPLSGSALRFLGRGFICRHLSPLITSYAPLGLLVWCAHTITWHFKAGIAGPHWHANIPGVCSHAYLISPLFYHSWDVVSRLNGNRTPSFLGKFRLCKMDLFSAGICEDEASLIPMF